MNFFKFIIIIFVFFTLVRCDTRSDSENEILFTRQAISVDGLANEAAWQKCIWKPMDQNWLGAMPSEIDFMGRYKILWDIDHIYVLAEITDDVLEDKIVDGLDRYWDDDCLEVFIDEDASGGNHQYNNNAFAYHIGLDNRLVDLGPDSLPHYYDHIKSRRRTAGNKSTWELSMQLYGDDFRIGQVNSSVKLRKEKVIGFAIAYCDNDGSEQRENFMGSVAVEGEDKNRGWIDAGIFEKMVLCAE